MLNRRDDVLSGGRLHTITELLQKTTRWFEQRGIDTARLDAELLLGAVLKLDRLHLYMDLERPLVEAEVAAYRELVARRGRHEPVAYILGEREFYGHTLKVTPAVLIPRPDTECVVEQALERLSEDAEGTVIDVATGSGAIAIAIAKARPRLRVIATDISEAALEVARKNVARHALQERVELRQGDLLAPCDDVRDARLIVSNPPYIKRAAEADLMPDVRDYEPHLALFGQGTDGLDHHRQVVRQAERCLAPLGSLVFEIGFGQGEPALALRTPAFDAGRLFADYGGNTRGIVFTRVSSAP